MSPENRESGKRVLPEIYQGPVGKIRFGIDYALRVGYLLINEVRGKPNPFLQKDK